MGTAWYDPALAAEIVRVRALGRMSDRFFGGSLGLCAASCLALWLLPAWCAAWLAGLAMVAGLLGVFARMVEKR